MSAGHRGLTRAVHSRCGLCCGGTPAGTVRSVATHDPTRDVQQFDAYRAALRDAVAGEVSQGARRKSLRGARLTTAKTPRPRSKG